MDSLTSLTSFVRTAETLSFVQAARLLGISASAVGKNVARLEHKLGVRLFNRSTRNVSLTAEGGRISDPLSEYPGADPGGRVRADQQSLTAHRQTEDLTARHWLPPVAPRPHRL
ncbi:LysR family transcriptional regulator [Klebsiella pneumoniae]|nr:LysR family transcriptional regulator [Klebsiella pneumoniae]